MTETAVLVVLDNVTHPVEEQITIINQLTNLDNNNMEIFILAAIFIAIVIIELQINSIGHNSVTTIKYLDAIAHQNEINAKQLKEALERLSSIEVKDTDIQNQIKEVNNNLDLIRTTTADNVAKLKTFEANFSLLISKVNNLSAKQNKSKTKLKLAINKDEKQTVDKQETNL